MKLARISKPLRSVQVRVTLAGDLNAALESYASYYEHVHGEAVDSKTLIPEIFTPFSRPTVSSRRGRVRALSSHQRRPDCASTNGSAKAQA